MFAFCECGTEARGLQPKPTYHRRAGLGFACTLTKPISISGDMVFLLSASQDF